MGDEDKKALDYIEVLLKRLADVTEEAHELRRQIVEALRKTRESYRSPTKPPTR